MTEYLMRREMFLLLGGLSSRILAGQPEVTPKDMLERRWSTSGPKHERMLSVVEKAGIPNVDSPAQLRKVLHNAYFVCSGSVHGSDEQLKSQIKDFISSGGVALLQAKHSAECAVLENIDKIAVLFRKP
ncbi:hypothetical protein GPECTOR_7g1122 [Gonium pectorale]|uniref:Uncharacterized protein n=1 Tax=Gonium pectorale TaxID=33097 RepID=A0A150GU58_GONPE|nr:hypothetical protein GPECTOR_7g1122 [Gonium pectorale]|eukprot:KXZ53228.1 hypothetical protein GPECTOR_7g1122 [Gonium pectorale]